MTLPTEWVHAIEHTSSGSTRSKSRFAFQEPTGTCDQSYTAQCRCADSLSKARRPFRSVGQAAQLDGSHESRVGGFVGLPGHKHNPKSPLPPGRQLRAISHVKRTVLCTRTSVLSGQRSFISSAQLQPCLGYVAADSGGSRMHTSTRSYGTHLRGDGYKACYRHGNANCRIQVNAVRCVRVLPKYGSSITSNKTEIPAGTCSRPVVLKRFPALSRYRFPGTGLRSSIKRQSNEGISLITSRVLNTPRRRRLRTREAQPTATRVSYSIFSTNRCQVRKGVPSSTASRPSSVLLRRVLRPPIVKSFAASLLASSRAWAHVEGSIR